MMPPSSSVGTALDELAKAAQGAGKTAEAFLRGLRESDIQAWIAGNIAGPAAQVATQVSLQGQLATGRTAGALGTFAQQSAQRGGQVAGGALTFGGKAAGSLAAGAGILAQQLTQGGQLAGKAFALGEASCEYLLSIAARLQTSSYTQTEDDFARILHALKAWKNVTQVNTMALVIRLSNVVGAWLKEFVFRISRAAMRVYGFALERMAVVLLNVGRVVFEVGTAAVRGAVVIALYAVERDRLQASRSIASLQQELLRLDTAVAAILDMIRTGQRLESARHYSIQATHEELLANVVSNLLKAGGSLSDIYAIAAQLAEIPLVTPAPPAGPVPIPYPVLKGSVLAEGWAAVKSQVAVTLGSVVQALKTKLGLTLAQAAQALVGAGIVAEDVLDALNGGWSATKTELAQALKGAGLSAKTIAAAMKNKLNAWASDTAQALKDSGFAKSDAVSALKDAGYAAADVAKALKDKYADNMVGAARAMKDAGWNMDTVADAVAGAWGMAKSAAQAALRAAGL